MLFQLPSDMGNKPSVSEGEDDEERAPLSVRVPTTPGAPELTNGGGEEAEDEVELPPPMKPIQEPILVAATTAPVIEENPCKRVSYFNLCYLNICDVLDARQVKDEVY